jgi:hypothetical protein
MDTKNKKLLIGFTVVAVGAGGYFLYKHLKKKGSLKIADAFRESVQQDTLPAPAAAKPASTPSGYKPKPANSTLPLKRGSKGILVKDVQTALVKQYGGSILPKYGADGYYGQEMETALKSKGLSTTIDNDLYAKILASKSSAEPQSQQPTQAADMSPATIASLLHGAILSGDVTKALEALWKIKNVTHYIKVNEKFKETRLIVSKTIVTALLDRFTSETNRTKIKAQLYRIGLKYNGSKWSLSGAMGAVSNRLITIQRAKIWDNSGKTMSVPNNTIIGTFIDANNGLTEFQTLDGKRLFIQTTAISYHHD